MDGTSTAGPGRIEARPANSENKNVASRSRGNAQRSVDPAAIQPRGTAGRVFCMRNSRCVQPVLLLLVVPLAACTVGPDFVKPEVSFNSSWREHEDGVSAENGAADRVWWQALDSPTLTTLVESAYNGNPNLQVAGLRIMQAQAQLNIATGAQYPQQQALSGSYTYRNRDPGLLDSDTDLVSQQIGLGATWEIDF